MPSRRNVLIGLGGLMAGGGALFATGAFTTVEAQRSVSVETAGDADAFLGLAPARGDGAFVTESDGTIEIQLDGEAGDATPIGQGLSQNAINTFRNLVTVTNQATQEITSVTLEFTESPASVDPQVTFTFPLNEFEGEGTDEADNGDNILTDNNGIPGTLTTGDSVNFGLTIDLLDGGEDGDLPEDGDYTLTITAETAETVE